MYFLAEQRWFYTFLVGMAARRTAVRAIMRPAYRERKRERERERERETPDRPTATQWYTNELDGKRTPRIGHLSTATDDW